MSRSSVTTTAYVCDRCGVEKVTDDGRPDGWDDIGFKVQFDKHRIFMNPNAPGPHEICPACVESFKQWLTAEGEE